MFLFLGHLATILCSIAYILPLFGFQASYRFYRLCLQSVVATSVVKLHARNGFPPVSGIGFSKEALAMFFERMKNWFTPVQLSTDFHYMFVAMAVSSHPPFTVSRG